MTAHQHPTFRPGDFLPTFIADTPINPRFEFDAVAGRTVLLCFLGSGTRGKAAEAVNLLRSMEKTLHRAGILIYLVTAHPQDRQADTLMSDDRRTLPFWDTDLKIHRAYGMVEDARTPDQTYRVVRNGCFVVGRNLRMTDFLSFAPLDTFLDRLAAAVSRIPAAPPVAQVGGHAPVLYVPDVFERDLCRRLIDEYEENGGGPSGVMRDVNGVTTGFFDDSVKRRRDAPIRNRDTLAWIRRNLINRLTGEIKKVYNFDATHIERFMVGCYDSGDSGFFSAHRDNGGSGTAHRRFAVSINLNAEQFEGGELWFPEYGPHLYKPATGGAVVFSCSMLHEARKVTAGRRYAFLPFLFDAKAAAIRDANRGFLSQVPPVQVKHSAA
ncbi:2OG-Fe(II) oxygenase [Thalassobaculum litoreum]|uniref:Predicted 2-oxoglutarate-and Fe(II)-dependent dioxygenase YbiX n=1 Tax=Thalassobaculum litoreum DSM 18839 TaxID=1123362 RepID=A0A8G2BKM4_9PROT|nr:2OG-Fe(II) oxygenase [Thalassobaculum litoreum]SDF92867.1 Predicted 2-oxoglutarate-and Fe(II)-dependent dioxygenase YbiX [Thalassobaculum litoreum DSM 18839]